MDEKDYKENWEDIMSSDAIAKRKILREKEKKLALKVWENMDNEGDIIEKKYWVHGFIIGLQYNDEDLTE